MSELNSKTPKEFPQPTASEALSNEAKEFQAILKNQLGISPDMQGIEQLLCDRVRETKSASKQCYISNLRTKPEHTEWQQLAELISIPETYFFRDMNQWEAFSQFAVPRSLERCRTENRGLRIWSAASATGEEMYSAAMALRDKSQTLTEIPLDTLIGTDLVESHLELARLGMYRKNSFRSDYHDYQSRYFKKVSDNAFEIQKDKIPDVEFQRLNLADQTAVGQFIESHGPFDIIFCRNVLIYLPTDVCRQLLEKFAMALAPDGVLFLGPAEFPALWTNALEPISTNGTFLWSALKPLAVSTPTEKQSEEKRNVVKEPIDIPIKNQEPASVSTTSFQNEQDLQNNPALESIKLLLEDVRNSEATDRLLAARALVDANDLVAEAHYALGTVLELLGDSKNAIKAYSQATFLESSFSLAHWRLAMLFAVDGNKQRARAELNWAIESLSKEPAERMSVLAQTDRETLSNVMEQTKQWLMT